jgi:uncharacterized protein YggE
MLRTLVVLVATLLLVPAASRAQRAGNAPPAITVTASHTLRLPADRATIYFLVEGTAETSDLALQRLAQKVPAVRQASMDGGLAVEPPAAFSYGLAQAQNNSGVPWPSNVVPFTARSAVRVQITQLDRLPDLIGMALAAGATSSSMPQFEFTGADTLRQSFLPIALQKARRDAEAVARGLNSTLGQAIEVSTYGSGGTPANPSSVFFTSRYDSGNQALLPEVSVGVSVTIQYRYTVRR